MKRMVFSFATVCSFIVLASSQAAAQEASPPVPGPAPTAKPTAPPPLAAFEGKKYSGVWLTSRGIGLTGVELVITGIEQKRLAGTMTFFPRLPVGGACGGQYAATGYVLKDGRLRLSVDRTVLYDGSQSTCGDKPIFFLRAEGPRLENDYLKLSER